MATYEHDGVRAHRKNTYMPCIIGPKFEEASLAEQVRILKATYWADNITKAEWPAVLRHDDCSPSAKSRLKKKAAGWLMALQRIAYLHPELFEEIVEKSTTMYRDQVECEPRVLFVWDGALFVHEQPVEVGSPVEWHPEANGEATT
jgi:hypothetical protein